MDSLLVRAGISTANVVTESQPRRPKRTLTTRGKVIKFGGSLYASNVLLSADALLDFICDNTVCKRCHNKIDRDAFCIYRAGIATDISYECLKCRSNKIEKGYTGVSVWHLKAARRHNQHLVAAKGKGRGRILDYNANIQAVVAAQLNGVLRSQVNSIFGILGLGKTCFQQWIDMEEEVSQYTISLGKTLLMENLNTSKSLSATDTSTGLYCLFVAIDCGWTKRASGRAYNSKHGYSVIICNHTRRVIAVVSLSKFCVRCFRFGRNKTAGEEVRPHRCPANYDGSSKGMEAYGALVNAKFLLHNGCLVSECTMDDDASTRKQLKAGTTTIVDGREVTLTGGGLPSDYPPIQFQSDLNHRL